MPTGPSHPSSSAKRKPDPHRGFSWSIRATRAREEQEHLLATAHDEEEHADSDGLYPPHCCWTSDNPDPPNPHRDLPVYENIHRIRRDIINSIDDPYSLDQLKGPRMNISVVRPLVDQYYDMQDASIVYCLLVNRCQFIREQSFVTHHQTVNLTRALLCELLAEKILRRYNENSPGPKGLLSLANILVAGFEPFQNAPEEVIKENAPASHWTNHRRKVGRADNKLTALEVAIVSESKSFLASSACQKVVDAIYLGKLVYTPNAFLDILPDGWKRRPISLYDPRRGPILNQYRLIVPRTRNAIEVCQFALLLALYFIVMISRENRSNTRYTAWELIFDIYATGWILDQIGSILEHGWKVYSQNLWSFLDVGFCGLFTVYLILRLHAFNISDEQHSTLVARTGLDMLSVAAPILIPRLAFNVMSENMLFVSLRAMMSDFLTLTLLAFWSFAGFLLSMKWLHYGAHETSTIGKWMIWIWFGLDGTGITASADFHWFLGPTLMIAFAFLGNTLFLTILVSMLSNTFSMIVSNAVPEIQYRRTVLTFEGVKSDAIFAYMPPFNILALVVMLPLKLLLSPRLFHKVNVAAVRTLNLPVLLFISWYERRTLWVVDKRRRGRPRSINWRAVGGPHVAGLGWWARTMGFWDYFSRFSVHGHLQAVFDHEPPQSVLDAIADEDDVERAPEGIGKALLNELNSQFPDSDGVRNRRRESNLGGGNIGNKDGGNDDSQRAKPTVRQKPKGSDPLRKEFASSGDESEDSEGHRKGSRRKYKRPERKDSIIDYSGNSDAAMHEASARLRKLEDAMMRIESMLEQIIEQANGEQDDDGGGGGGGGGEDGGGEDGGEHDLERQTQTGILK